MSFMKKKNEGDESAAEELKKKAFNDEYNLETGTLLIQAKRFTEAVKILKREGKNIHRKRGKETSRFLSQCMDTYDEHLNEVNKSLASINQHLVKSPKNTKNIPISSQKSQSFSGRHGRTGHRRIEERVEESPRDEVPIENPEWPSAGNRKRARHSEPYQTERTGTDDDFERYDRKSSASAQRNALEMLEQKVKSLEKETERLQHELQAEKTEKDKVFKELEDAKRETHALDDKLRDLQKHSSKEKDDLEEDISRLRQEKDRISDERDNNRCQYETEKEAKDNALKKLSRENDHISRERDDERKRYKTEKDAKDYAVARLEAINRDKCAVEEELKKMKKQSANEKATLEKQIKRLEDMKQEKCAVEKELKSLIKQSSDEKFALEKNMKSLRQEKDMSTHERDNDRRQYKADINVKENAIERLEEELKRHITQSSDEKFALEKVMKRLRQDTDNISHEREKERKQYMAEKEVNENTLKRMQHERDKAIQQCKAEKAAKDDALSRLSTLASSRLRDNNPNITDLSDQNRPTKIAEKMAELYDNQWTDAFDALEQTDKNEREIISLLLESLMTAYDECSKLANDNFFEKVQRVMECPLLVDKQLLKPVLLSDQLKQEIKEFRKNQATKVWKEIEAIVLPNIQLSSYHQQEIGAYLSLCVEISWLMVVQDPPLVLNDKAQDRFDTNTFKDYTKRGPIVEFVVWPALLLHESGPLLAKGVAQGCIGQQISNQNDQANAERKLSTQSMRLLYTRDKSDQDQARRMASTFSATTGTQPQGVFTETFKPPPDSDE